MHTYTFIWIYGGQFQLELQKRSANFKKLLFLLTYFALCEFITFIFLTAVSGFQMKS